MLSVVKKKNCPELNCPCFCLLFFAVAQVQFGEEVKRAGKHWTEVTVEWSGTEGEWGCEGGVEGWGNCRGGSAVGSAHQQWRMGSELDT